MERLALLKNRVGVRTSFSVDSCSSKKGEFNVN